MPNLIIAIIWEAMKKKGYCHTINEADDLCKKNPNYTWSPAENNEENKKNLDFMTIYD